MAQVKLKPETGKDYVLIDGIYRVDSVYFSNIPDEIAFKLSDDYIIKGRDCSNKKESISVKAETILQKEVPKKVSVSKKKSSESVEALSKVKKSLLKKIINTAEDLLDDGKLNGSNKKRK